MEDKEKEKEDEEKNGILVKAKRFLCLHSKEGVNLKEIHKHWKRDLDLTLEQAHWIIDGILIRKTYFNEYRRKESRSFG